MIKSSSIRASYAATASIVGFLSLLIPLTYSAVCDRVRLNVSYTFRINAQCAAVVGAYRAWPITFVSIQNIYIRFRNV